MCACHASIECDKLLVDWYTISIKSDNYSSFKQNNKFIVSCLWEEVHGEGSHCSERFSRSVLGTVTT